MMPRNELDKENFEIYKKIGEKIALKRKKKRRKVQGISKKLNINVVFLDLIEEGNFLKIPKHVPRLGFVRSYAKYLEVDISKELSEISSSNTTGFKNENKKFVINKGFEKFASFLLFLILLLTILFFFK
jgi:cytoskeletal protein RodZ|tara:strand:- start:45 stop:431 length:387 start_codon:yes stop_codon:yes gene_type:complete